MRLGIIDLGTNSVRFDVHQILRGGVVHLLHREKLMIRLGQRVFLDGRLDPHAIRRATHAFMSFRKSATLLHTDKIIAFGTSALREASDAEEFVQLIRRKTGIDIRVISGNEEAQLIALGILANENPPKGRFALVDIGGGSTEISICEEKKILHSASFPLGAARLQQVFLKTSPPTSSQGLSAVSSLRRYTKSVLLPKMIAEEWSKVPLIVGSSGTIRALSRILSKKTSPNHGINRKPLSKLVDSMNHMTRAQLLKVPGMEAKRVDLILSGAILLQECMDCLGAQEFNTTHYSLRDGILDREIQSILQKGSPETRFQIKDVLEKVKKLGGNEAHLRQVLQLAEGIFDETQRLHRLDPKWKRYLAAAAILHDIGKIITPIHHEVHSYYIVRHFDFVAMEKWESEFIAQLCLRHNAGKLSKKDLEFTEDRTHRVAFIRLLAILRVADALDQGHQSKLRLKRAKIDPRKVTLRVSSKHGSDLEILRAEQKKRLFEETFKRNLLIETT